MTVSPRASRIASCSLSRSARADAGTSAIAHVTNAATTVKRTKAERRITARTLRTKRSGAYDDSHPRSDRDVERARAFVQVTVDHVSHRGLGRSDGHAGGRGRVRVTGLHGHGAPDPR